MFSCLKGGGSKRNEFVGAADDVGEDGEARPRRAFVERDVAATGAVRAAEEACAAILQRLQFGRAHRAHAADFVGRYYYRQNPKLLRWALTNPLDRVMYTPLTPLKPDFDMVRDLMIETGVLNKKIEFSEYTDVSFAEGKKLRTAWKYEPGDAHAE